MDQYKKHVDRSSRVLEIGASATEYTKDLNPHCKELVGIEVMPERTPDDFENVHYITGDWHELTKYVEPNSIDVAIACHVIEHVQDDLKCMNELYAALKPGGFAIISTPNRRRLTRTIIELFTPERKFPWWEHMREYVEADLEALLEESDFTEYEIEPIVFGVHGGPVFLYMEKVPRRFRKYATFYEVRVFKG